MRRLRPAVARSLAALVLLSLTLAAGCGEDDEDERPAAGNPIDRAFAAGMVPHHEGAVDMARIAKGEARHRELRSLADAIIASQTAEIRTLRREDRQLGEEGVRKGDLGLGRHAMGMDHDVHELRSTKQFDRAFIDMMVPHHEGAIRMSRIELKQGEDAELRRLAREIIAAQEREIREMREWRKDWYGASGGKSGHGHPGHGHPGHVGHL